MLSEKILAFYKSLRPPGVPEGVEILNPYADEAGINILRLFLRRFYNDSNPRQLLFGINPGRFGAGTTGINFTAPRQLSGILNIKHHFRDQSELSAEFIYEVIDRYGGPGKFYSDFFLTSVSPLGFTRSGKNLNYYDDTKLTSALELFMHKAIETQVKLFRPSGTCICIGGEKNFSYLTSINSRLRLFETIIPVPHPRFIMQYRRKQKEDYILQYLSALQQLKQ